MHLQGHRCRGLVAKTFRAIRKLSCSNLELLNFTSFQEDFYSKLRGYLTTLAKMSLLNSSCSVPMHSAPGGNVEIPANFWSDTDAELLAGCDVNSFLASVFQDMPHFLDLEDENETTISYDGQTTSAEFSMAEFPHIGASPDGVTDAYGDFSRVEGSSTAESDAPAISETPGPPQRNYSFHDLQMEESEEGRLFGSDFGQVSNFAKAIQTCHSSSRLTDYEEASHNAQHADGPSVLEAAWSLDLPTSTSMFSSELQPPLGCVSGSPSMEEGATTCHEQWPASTPSQSPLFTSNSVSRSNPGDATRLAGDSPGGTVSSGWRQQPIVEMCGFMDLSDFLSPRLTSSGHFTAEQRTSLGMDRSLDNNLELQTSTAQGHNMMVSTREITIGRTSSTSNIRDSQLVKRRIMSEEKQLKQFPGTFVSVRQDQVALEDPVHTHLAHRSFVASSKPASFHTTTSFEQQLHNPWESSSKLHSDQPLNFSNAAPVPPGDPEEPKLMPVTALAPVTPEKPRKRRTPSHRQQVDGHNKKYAGASPLPADRCISNAEAGPSKSSKPRKLQKLAPFIEPNSVLQQIGVMDTHLLGVQGGYGNSFQGANTRDIVFPATKDVGKAGDHVVRERRRRDLMNTRYQTLDSLLPKLPCRRDRFCIVEDTKVYVKEMEKMLSDLRRTREDSKTRLEAALVAKEKEEQEKTKAMILEPATISPLTTIQVPGSSTSEDLKVDVVIDQRDGEHEVVIFVQCRSSCGAKLFSSLLRGIEKLHLDVSQCSTSKSSQFFFCNAVCKLQKHVVKSSLSRKTMIQEMVTTLRFSLEGERSTK